MSVRAGAVPGSRPPAAPAEATAEPTAPVHRPLHAVLTTGLAAGAADLVAKATPTPEPEPVRRLERILPAPAPVAAVFDGLTLRHDGAEEEEEAETGMFKSNWFSRKARSMAGKAASTAEVELRLEWDPDRKDLPLIKFSVDCELWDAGCAYVFAPNPDENGPPFFTDRLWKDGVAPEGLNGEGIYNTAVFNNMVPDAFKTKTDSKTKYAHAVKAVRLVNAAYRALHDTALAEMRTVSANSEDFFPDVMMLTMGYTFKEYFAEAGRLSQNSRYKTNAPQGEQVKLFDGDMKKEQQSRKEVMIFKTVSGTEYAAVFQKIKAYAGIKKMLLVAKDTEPKGDNGTKPNGGPDKDGE